VLEAFVAHMLAQGRYAGVVAEADAEGVGLAPRRRGRRRGQQVVAQVALPAWAGVLRADPAPERRAAEWLTPVQLQLPPPPEPTPTDPVATDKG
jgi:hypothetical protein